MKGSAKPRLKNFFEHQIVFQIGKERVSISKKKKTEDDFMKYVCDVCGWVYDENEGYPEGGIAPGTKFEDLPDDFECPLCGVGKDSFSAE